MKLKKIDLSGVKAYLFQKGERVGLVVFGVIAVLLLGLGLLKAVGAGTNYADQYKKQYASISVKLKAAKELPPAPIPQPKYPWPDQGVTLKDPTPLMPFGDSPDKPQNPDILAIMSDQMQIEVIKGGYLCIEQDAKGNALALNGDATKLAKIMKPVRMVVVTTEFPMKEQWEEFRRVLNYPSLAELNNFKADQPRPLGLEVFRREVKVGAADKADTKENDWEPLYKYDVDKDTPFVADRLQKFYKEALIDQDNQTIFKNHLQRGLATPLPVMANVMEPNKQYLRPNLKGIRLEAYTPTPVTQAITATGNPGSGFPGKTLATADPKWTPIPLDKLADVKIAEKLKGKIDFFDASSELEGATPGGVIATKPPPRPRGPRGFIIPGTPGTPGAPTDLVVDKVVRFVDIGVEPGKTYQYAFRVRFANPNFGNTDAVAYLELAAIKELVSKDAFTPEIKIPEEYFVYAADLYALGHMVDRGGIRDGGVDRGSDTKPAKADASVPYGLWNTPIQVHTWVGKVNDEAVADWAIAERLLIRRGDLLGRRGVLAEVPMWKKDKENFAIAFQVQKVAQAKAKQGYQPRADTGIPIDFIRGEPPPLLVDFEGGFKKFKAGLAPELKDECAVDLLVLNPDGTLTVRNSRVDTDPENSVSSERTQRWEEWLSRIQSLRHVPGGKN